MIMTMMWLQADATTDYMKWLTILVGFIALAFLLQGIAILFLAVKAAAFMKDIKATFDETKGKAMPLIGKVTDITASAQSIVADLVPKIKVVSENVTEMSHTVRQTVSKLDVTIRDAADKASITFADVDSRTKTQVARVDGMVASTLAATAEIGATINEGIRVPARKIAAFVTQAKHFIDTLADRAKALGLAVESTIDAKIHPKAQPKTKL